MPSPVNTSRTAPPGEVLQNDFSEAEEIEDETEDESKRHPRRPQYASSAPSKVGTGGGGGPRSRSIKSKSDDNFQSDVKVGTRGRFPSPRQKRETPSVHKMQMKARGAAPTRSTSPRSARVSPTRRTPQSRPSTSPTRGTQKARPQKGTFALPERD